MAVPARFALQFNQPSALASRRESRRNFTAHRDKFLNILPTVTIREGHPVKIYFSDDLAVPNYVNHKMPTDI
jgi:type IV secretion system protein VirB10